MNDFTKEELVEIKRCLKCVISSHTMPYSSNTMELNKKIRLMIDNYGDSKCQKMKIDFSNATIRDVRND